MKYTVALGGNPNVGKSTVFNALTGSNQHTGNWPGKTVASARGSFVRNEIEYELVDLPGTYSLMAHSVEEEVARDFLCLEKPDAVVLVCDATCLRRNLNLVLQTLEITPNVVVCVNLLDEAQKKGIQIDLKALSEKLGVPVVGAAARQGEGLEELTQQIAVVCAQAADSESVRTEEDAIEDSAEASEEMKIHSLVGRADQIGSSVTVCRKKNWNERDRRLDRILTGKGTGIPIMLLLLCLIFWITISGANYPSQLLSTGLFWIQERLTDFFRWIGAPEVVHGILVLGIYRVLAWVVSVMLPPMMIFFPLFTLLEDFGYLPRIAFVLDKPFQKCRACGKQALTMCMGFGCNAVGVTGCRIIDSPRERMIAILTNCFVPCNGRFPTLISIITMFFLGGMAGIGGSFLSAVMLTAVILAGVVMTFLVSRILSATLLKGIPSSFALELPPYRRPQFGKVIVRSVLDRTLFVLGRAVTIAIPAGLIIWLMGNIMIGESSLLVYIAGFLDPFARLLGMDGIILLAFILGFPANEIVVPIILMGYLSVGTLTDMSDLMQLKAVLSANGWTWMTAVSVLIFSLMHWPCGTTCLTIKKETGSMKWTLLAAAIPTAAGLLLCMAFTAVCKIFL